MKITSDVIEVLKACEISGVNLKLPGTLERKLYERTAKILKAMGGKWSSSKKAFVFKSDVSDILTGIVDTGQYVSSKVLYQFFPTPDSLAKQIVARAKIEAGETCLEPSAGRGAIARHMPDPDCVELDPENRKILETEGFNLVGEDFMAWTPSKSYDVIVMNPPFCKGQDARHIIKAIEIANKRVVAIASSSVAWRNDSICCKLRDMVTSYNGHIEELPPNSFRESGTNVNTVLIVVDKVKKEATKS